MTEAAERVPVGIVRLLIAACALVTLVTAVLIAGIGPGGADAAPTTTECSSAHTTQANFRYLDCAK